MGKGRVAGETVNLFHPRTTSTPSDLECSHVLPESLRLGKGLSVQGRLKNDNEARKWEAERPLGRGEERKGGEGMGGKRFEGSR